MTRSWRTGWTRKREEKLKRRMN